MPELLLETEGNPNKQLTAENYTPEGELKTLEDDLALVVQSAQKAEQFISNKQWNLMWRDSDLLYQSPRPMTVFENTYILEPNVQRFTVAKVCNAIVPQLYKGLFYQDPPMILRPRPGTSQDTTDAKTALFSYLLDFCKFKQETKWGLEQMAHLGTGIWKWGIEYIKIDTPKRKATAVSIPTGKDGSNTSTDVVLDQDPDITIETRIVPRPFFMAREISRVLVASNLEVSDIRQADCVVDVWYTDFYQIQELQEGVTNKDGDLAEGWSFPPDLKNLWATIPSGGTTPKLMSDQSSHVTGIVHHAEEQNLRNSPDPLCTKLEILEYWDKGRKIIVLDRKKVIFTGKNPFKQIPFLSANWWNRPKAFYGMGLGLIVGQNQRVDQGTINSILKILSFGVNPLYLRRRDANAPTQMIRTSIGKILTVDVPVGRPVSDAYGLLETPRVPTEVWAALQESERNTESTSGADQTLVQGSTAGPRSGMGRTATGATNMASASATRLDGPLDNFIEQVFKPFLYILDYLVFNYVSDLEIKKVLGDELGKDYQVDMQKFHDGRHEYEILAGASLAAKRQMAQSLTLITQIFQNPNIQENLADINGEYIDFKPILNMWMEASEWKNRQDIIKKLTPEMIQRRQERSQAAQAASKTAQTAQLNDQKFQQKQQLQSEATDDRIKRDLVIEAFRTSGTGEAEEGAPTEGGLEGGTPEVE